MRFLKQLMLHICIILAVIACQSSSTEIDLSGRWQVALDSLDQGVKEAWYNKHFSHEIKLPGTLCDGGYGTPSNLEPMMEKSIFLNLKRKYNYVGVAWYKREVNIPKEWCGQFVALTLERIIWNSQVWVNGTKVEGANESLSTPHCYDLTPYLQPGKNQIAIRVDNRQQHDISVNSLAHAYTNDTQIIWNGILGKIGLKMKPINHIQELLLFPDVDGKKVVVYTQFSGDTAGKLTLLLKDAKGKKLSTRQVEVLGRELTIDYPIEQLQIWDEFTPNLYQITAQLEHDEGTDIKSERFGMRKITNHDGLLQINQKRIFLRGTLECSIFPLTGYPPTDKAGWHKVFDAARQHGLNHLRFHSWCPPKAAFEVADEMGFYLQVELPHWALKVGDDKTTLNFLCHEGKNILREYGNHPSFCFFSLGNELQGDFQTMRTLLNTLKEGDNRRLYTTTTFTFERGHGDWPEEDDEFWVTQWTKHGWVRGQGIFDDQPPSFDQDFSASISNLTVPLISHEIGQYSVYPNLKEIPKYTGNLLPLNFKAVKQDLAQKERLHLADDYLLASGKLALLLYKEEIERALKTPNFSGFQLLDLQDFPGQGTALVGIVDAFWESKGLISPKEFRHFCSSVVPLARFPKAVYRNNETFQASFEAANFSGYTLAQVHPLWSLENSKGEVVANGQLKYRDIPLGNSVAQGSIAVPLSSIKQAEKLTLSIEYECRDYRNQWSIWVYPEHLPETQGEVLYTRSFEEAEQALKLGRNVLLNPPLEAINGLSGKFVPVFWSPVHFPNQPGTMGILCNPNHPALAHFPTDMHADWQWWDLCKNAKTMQLDTLEVQPLITMVDNFFKNRNLGLAFEVNSENGKLIVCSTDLTTHLTDRPVAQQLRYSLISYMESAAFNPTATISFATIKQSLHDETHAHNREGTIYD